MASRSTQGLQQLLESCKSHHISIEVLGLGEPFRGVSEKLLHVQNYLKTLPEEDLFLFVDAYDVLFLTHTKEIIERFLAMNSSFVISVERYCYPHHQLKNRFPKSPTSFRYINSGSYMGYVGHIKKILEEIAPVRLFTSDQGLLTLHYFEHPEAYAFDVYCQLFLPLAGVIEQELTLDCEKKRVYMEETGSTPCLIHGNGGGRSIYQSIYELFFNASS